MWCCFRMGCPDEGNKQSVAYAYVSKHARLAIKNNLHRVRYRSLEKPLVIRMVICVITSRAWPTAQSVEQ